MSVSQVSVLASNPEQSGQMDTHYSDPVSSAIWNQGQRLIAQEEQLRQFQQVLTSLAEHQEDVLGTVSAQLSNLTSCSAQSLPDQGCASNAPVSASVSTTSVPVQLARPEKFSGELGDC